jgi:hypothetical protein
MAAFGILFFRPKYVVNLIGFIDMIVDPEELLKTEKLRAL